MHQPHVQDWYELHADAEVVTGIRVLAVSKRLPRGCQTEWTAYWQTLLQLDGNVPLLKSLEASVQLSALMSLRHWLAAPLLNVFPAGHAAEAQLAAVSTEVVHWETETLPRSLQELALLQTAEAAELHAAWGVLVSEPLQAPRSKETEIEARMRRMQEPSRLSSSFESQLSGKGDGCLNSWVVGAQSDSARLSLLQSFRQPLRRRARARQRWQARAAAVHPSQARTRAQSMATRRSGRQASVGARFRIAPAFPRAFSPGHHP
jgi:hypothetical protein